MNRIHLIALIGLILAPAASAALTPGAIDVVNFAFRDASTGLSATVASAGVVTWTDVSGVHTVTATDGSFDSGPLEPGQTFRATLASGAYPYVCAFHPSMRGTLVVV